MRRGARAARLAARGDHGRRQVLPAAARAAGAASRQAGGGRDRARPRVGREPSCQRAGGGAAGAGGGGRAGTGAVDGGGRAGGAAVAPARGPAGGVRRRGARRRAGRAGQARAGGPAGRGRHIAELTAGQRLHNELDRASSDLRAELSAQMRPETAELASGFLADLTDGRYDELDLTEDYTVTILEAGVPKPVISGGEEDVANPVLRLAISPMIAQRAGQPLAPLGPDAVFGSAHAARGLHGRW